MADTQQTLTALLALLADNITEAISAQDVRDIVETLRNGHGEISVSITSTSSYFPDAGTYTLSANDHNWDMSTNGQLRYIGTAPRAMIANCSFSMTSAGNNQVAELVITKNGTPLTPSVVRRKIGTGSDVGTGALHAFTSVVNGDYLDVRIRNTTSTANLTLETCNLFAMDMAL